MMIGEVATRLQTGRRTLEGWLSKDMQRHSDDRRFQFHVRHGRKRLWTEESFLKLQAAIQRESEPGGVLAAGGRQYGETQIIQFVPQSKIEVARQAVLDFPLRPPIKSGKRSRR